MNKNFIKESEFANKWVSEDLTKCAQFRWEQKTIYNIHIKSFERRK